MRWAIISGMYNVADLAAEFCRYHLDLGVDQIWVADYGSMDGTLDVVRPLVRDGTVRLITVPTHRFKDFDPSNALLNLIRTEAAADCVSFLDPDEFLIGPVDLETSLAHDWEQGVEAIAVSRFNLTGIGPIPEGTHYLAHLTQKIIATDVRVSSAAAPLSSPWIFSRLPPKVIVRVQSKVTIATGDHDVCGAEKRIVGKPLLEILHLPVRSYASFQRKIEDTTAYFAANPDFGPGIGWHWRRWIELLKAGKLDEEYNNQFLAQNSFENLRAAKRIVEDQHLAAWLLRAPPLTRPAGA
jgi:hypothetical protein